MEDLSLQLSNALSNLGVNCSDRKQVSEFVNFLYQDQPDTEKTAELLRLKRFVINFFTSLPSENINITGAYQGLEQDDE